ncbi:hypothetical protein BU25DRAFT_457096 [Macroventuria anomochaeta]|uniref:Uncharacterized protein n=1 Tax=Macroventuria anomochaeta TaxID=301207 RepID=A0ACB6S5W5_9PLEO|nr:uncharacterized protein BU25DRAFT_457096 [Macroventuria anomochaeta]KAF2629433.1 hypothetical protein BU25DRAFT_457096 [Macroventuria anomochaeta]
MDPSQLEKLRPCGRLETYSTARHQLGFYNNVGLTATYTTSSTQDIPFESLVSAALHHVIAEHPNLSAIPVNEERSYPDVYFARLPEIDLRTCVVFRHRKRSIPKNDEADDELDKLLREQHDRNFKGDVRSRPYWRLIIASSPETPGEFTASWIFHHALSDGASSMLFHQSFLEGLNAVSVQKTIDPVVRTPSTQLLPPLEELHPMTISWPIFLRAIAGSLLPSYFAQHSPNLWTGYPVDAIVQTPTSSHNTSVILTAELTTAFAKKCRAEATSVTAAISTLLATILFRDTLPHNELRIGTPISLRPFLSIPKSCMVNAITNHTFIFNYNGNNSRSIVRTFSWDIARQVKAGISQELAKQGADNPVALLKYVSNMQDYFLEKLGKPRDSSAEVSNLGVWRPQNSSISHEGEAKWSLGRLTFSQSLNRTGPQISLSAVTGGDGCMALSFNWPEELVQYEREYGENLLHMIPGRMKEGIKALLKEEVEE